MADGPYYNFEVECSTGISMDIYLPSDMDEVVASDSDSNGWCRALDFPYYDESGYAYVKLVSLNENAIGTITCGLSIAPMFDG